MQQKRSTDLDTQTGQVALKDQTLPLALGTLVSFTTCWSNQNTHTSDNVNQLPRSQTGLLLAFGCESKGTLWFTLHGVTVRKLLTNLSRQQLQHGLARSASYTPSMSGCLGFRTGCATVSKARPLPDLCLFCYAVSFPAASAQLVHNTDLGQEPREPGATRPDDLLFVAAVHMSCTFPNSSTAFAAPLLSAQCRKQEWP
jgi:hypothetical protein